MCVLGGTGEPLSLSTDESRQVIDTVATAAQGELKIIVGCLGSSQADIITLGRHACSVGAEAAMILPPYFVVPTPSHITRHFAEIAERVDLPLVLFNSPARAGTTLGVEHILSLIDAIPSVVGIKDAGADMIAATELIRPAPAHFALLQGLDELILPTLAMGGTGVIVSGACLVPRLVVELSAAFHAGELERARELQFALMPLCEAIYREPNPGALKVALAMAGRDAGPTRAPIGPIEADTRTMVERVVSDLGDWT